jgi:hypothetical protein
MIKMVVGSSIIYDTFGGIVEVTTIIRKRQRRGEEAASGVTNPTNHQ